MPVGAIISGGSAVIGYMQEDDARDDAERRAKRRARVAKQNAKIVRKQGAEDARRFRQSSRQRLGSARAAVGGSGVQMTGSALDSITDSARNMELDALTIEYEADMRAWNFEQSGEDFDLRAKNIDSQQAYATASTLLGLGTDLYGQYGGTRSRGR